MGEEENRGLTIPQNPTVIPDLLTSSEKIDTAQEFLQKRANKVDYARKIRLIRKSFYDDQSTDIISANQVFFEDTGHFIDKVKVDLILHDNEILGNVDIGFSLSADKHTGLTGMKFLMGGTVNTEVIPECDLQASLASSGYEIKYNKFGAAFITKQTDGRNIEFFIVPENNGVLRFVAHGLVEKDFEEALQVLFVLVPNAFSSPQELRIKLSDVTRKNAKESKRYDSLKMAGEYLSDPDIEKKMDQEMVQAIATINSLNDEAERLMALEILERSLDNLPRILADSYMVKVDNATTSQLLQIAKEKYLQEAQDMRISRAGDKGYLGEFTELEMIIEGKPRDTFYSSLVSHSSGEPYLKKYGHDKAKEHRDRIQYHFKNTMAVRCSFYLGDVDSPDTEYQGGLERHALSFVDAKLLEALMDAEDSIYRTRNLDSLMGENIIEGRITGRQFTIKAEDLIDIEIPKKLIDNERLARLKEKLPFIKIIII